MLFEVQALTQADFDDLAAEPDREAAAATPAPAPSAGGSAPAQTTLELTAQNVAYDQTTLSAPAGQPFTIHFKNNDAGMPPQRRDHGRTGAAGLQG